MAEVQQPTTQTSLSFVERLSANDTIRNTTAGGWFTLLGGIFAGVIIGRILGSSLLAVSRRLETRGWQMRSIVVRSIAGPSNLAIIGLGISVGLARLAPSPQLNAAAAKGLAFLYIIAIGWLFYNLVDLVSAALRNITARTENRLDDQLVPLITKSIRIFFIVLVALFTAENIFNANIGAWLAGLGIAGLAVSLAAQDSIKNIFGSATILMDQPFAVGDVIKMEGFTGTVEDVGFRSTRIRTLAGSLVTLPNSKVADTAIENLQRRATIRRDFAVTITYDTPLEKIHEALAIIREILAEPDIACSFDLEKLPPRVFFNEMNTDSLNLAVTYWFQPTDFWAYQAHCEKVNFRIMERFTQAGIEMAFPTQTLFLAADPKRPFPSSRNQADQRNI